MGSVREPGRRDGARWLGVAEASRLLGVHPTTLRQWTAQGSVRAFLTPGGHRRYREADLLAFRAQLRPNALGRSLATAILTVQPRCGFSGPVAGQAFAWLHRCDEASRQRPRLLGGALARLLARYVSTDGEEAEQCLRQATVDAAEYAALAREFGLSPAAAVEAFTVCRAPIVAAAEQWAGQASTGDHEAVAILSRVSRFFDETLLSMVRALEHAATSGEVVPAG